MVVSARNEMAKGDWRERPRATGAACLCALARKRPEGHAAEKGELQNNETQTRTRNRPSHSTRRPSFVWAFSANAPKGQSQGERLEPVQKGFDSNSLVSYPHHSFSQSFRGGNLAEYKLCGEAC